MCGIVGAVAEKNVVPILMEGLRRLEYRGYDSAGIAIRNGAVINRMRRVGKVKELQDALDNEPLHGVSGISHTRWAREPQTAGQRHSAGTCHWRRVTSEQVGLSWSGGSIPKAVVFPKVSSRSINIPSTADRERIGDPRGSCQAHRGIPSHPVGAGRSGARWALSTAPSPSPATAARSSR